MPTLTLKCLVIYLVLSGTAQAEVILRADREIAIQGGFGLISPTEFEGYSRWVLSLESDEGLIETVDASFTGPLSQSNPAGNSSIFPFVFYSGFFGAEELGINADSHFLPESNLSLVSSVASNSALLSESNTNLSGNLVELGPLNDNGSLKIAQLVIPDGEIVNYNLLVNTASGPTNLTGFVGVPEPSTAVLCITMTIFASGYLRRR